MAKGKKKPCSRSRKKTSSIAIIENSIEARLRKEFRNRIAQKDCDIKTLATNNGLLTHYLGLSKMETENACRERDHAIEKASHLEKILAKRRAAGACR